LRRFEEERGPLTLPVTEKLFLGRPASSLVTKPTKLKRVQLINVLFIHQLMR